MWGIIILFYLLLYMFNIFHNKMWKRKNTWENVYETQSTIKGTTHLIRSADIFRVVFPRAPLLQGMETCSRQLEWKWGYWWEQRFPQTRAQGTSWGWEQDWETSQRLRKLPICLLSLSHRKKNLFCKFFSQFLHSFASPCVLDFSENLSISKWQKMATSCTNAEKPLFLS